MPSVAWSSPFGSRLPVVWLLMSLVTASNEAVSGPPTPALSAKAVRASANTGLHGGHSVQSAPARDLEDAGEGVADSSVGHALAAAQNRAVESYLMDLDAEGGDVLLLELTGQVTLDEGRLADSAVSDEDELELGHFLCGGLS